MLRADAGADAHRPRLRPAHGRKAPPPRAGRRGRAAAADPRRVQVLQLLRRLLPRALRHRPRRVAEHPPARRHLLLYLPVAQLHHRRLPRQARPRARFRQDRAVHRLLPAARRRTHRQGRGLHPPAARGADRHDGGTRPRRAVLRLRPVQEDRAGRQPRRLRRRRARRARRLQRRHPAADGLRLRHPDLLRLLRLLRHGRRLRPHPRL